MVYRQLVHPAIYLLIAGQWAPNIWHLNYSVCIFGVPMLQSDIFGPSDSSPYKPIVHMLQRAYFATSSFLGRIRLPTPEVFNLF